MQICSRSLTGELDLNGLPHGLCRHQLVGDALRVTAKLDDAAQRGKFITTLGTAVQVLLLGRGQRIVNAQRAIGEPIGTQVGHDVTSAS